VKFKPVSIHTENIAHEKAKKEGMRYVHADEGEVVEQVCM